MSQAPTDRQWEAWTTEQEQRLTALLAAGHSLSECARLLKRSYRSVQCHLDANRHLRPAAAQSRRKWTPEDDAKLLALLDQGLRPAHIARRLAKELGREEAGITNRLGRLRKGTASTAKQMGRPRAGEAPTYAALVQRHCRTTPPAPQTEADEHAARRAAWEAARQRTLANGDLYQRWCRWNDAVAARNAARAGGAPC